MKPMILVDTDRCTGCWSCSMACKVAHDLAADDWWLFIRTLGSGNGIDDPAGEWPDCNMSWQPVYTKSCTLCQDRAKEGNLPYCAYNCPTHALTYGDADDPESALSQRLAVLQERGSSIYTMPAFENTRKNVIYSANSKSSR